MNIDIPGYGRLRLAHLVIDVDGALSTDGELNLGVARLLRDIAPHLTIHLLVNGADRVNVRSLDKLPVQVKMLPGKKWAQEKNDYVKKVGFSKTIAIGHARSDFLMLANAVLGIGVLPRGGASASLLHAADVICSRIDEALELIIHPNRLIGTLRV